MSHSPPACPLGCRPRTRDPPHSVLFGGCVGSQGCARRRALTWVRMLPLPFISWGLWASLFTSLSRSLLDCHVGMADLLGGRCRLNICVPQFVCGGPNLQCDGIWGLGEVPVTGVGLWSDGISALKEGAPESILLSAASSPREDTVRRQCLQSQQDPDLSPEPTCAGTLTWGCQAPGLWEDKILILKPPGLCFCGDQASRLPPL